MSDTELRLKEWVETNGQITLAATIEWCPERYRKVKIVADRESEAPPAETHQDACPHAAPVARPLTESEFSTDPSARNTRVD